MSNPSGEQINLAQKYLIQHQQRLSAKRRKYPNLDEDLWQTVFLKLAKVDDNRWNETVKEPDNFIQRTYSHCLIDALKKAAKEREQLNGFGQRSVDEIKTGQNPVDVYVNLILLDELLNMCSAEERPLFKLLYEGAQTKQIAAVMNLSEEAVRKRIQRLREKLRFLREGGDKDPP